ncbi:CaiB/BaiF CoA transferase family protein [Thermodesulfobacteriota bacterium]
MGILSGIRVIDWTIWQMGPVAAAMLADLGAEVIKLEPPGVGDPGRGLVRGAGVDFKLPEGRNAYVEINNRHKQSITVDIKQPKGREIVHNLVSKSDIFMQNVRGGVAERYGLDYEGIRKHNPKIVYVSGSGYGSLGPDREKPIYDYLGMARSGIMSCVGEHDMPPLRVEGGIGDQVGAILMAYSALAGLIARDRLGVGQQVEVSQLSALMSIMGLNIGLFLLAGNELTRQKRTEAENPLWNLYQCGDGKWIVLAMPQTQRHWPHICRAMGRVDLENDARFATDESRFKHHEELIKAFDETFAAKPREEWVEIFKPNPEIFWERVNDIPGLARDEQVTANQYITDFQHPVLGKVKIPGSLIKFSETPADPGGIAPEVGEHTELVLTEICGYTWEEVEKLGKEGVI